MFWKKKDEYFDVIKCSHSENYGVRHVLLYRNWLTGVWKEDVLYAAYTNCFDHSRLNINFTPTLQYKFKTLKTATLAAEKSHERYITSPHGASYQVVKEII